MAAMTSFHPGKCCLPPSDWKNKESAASICSSARQFLVYSTLELGFLKFH